MIRPFPMPAAPARVWLLLPAIAGLILLTTACGSSSSKLEGPTDTIAIVKANCVSCHGSELQGRMGPETNLQQVGKRLSREQIAHQIQEGGGGMPAFGDRLTAEEIDKVASWLGENK